MVEEMNGPKIHRRGFQPGNGTLYDLEIGLNPATGKLACVWWKEGGSGGVAICFDAGSFAAPIYIAEKMRIGMVDATAISLVLNRVSESSAPFLACPGIPLTTFKGLVNSVTAEVEVEERGKKERGEGYPFGV